MRELSNVRLRMIQRLVDRVFSCILAPLICGAVWLAADEITSNQPQQTLDQQSGSHWSFRPLKHVHPKLRSDSSRSSIDDYVHSELEIRRLNFSVPAERSDLLRRLHLQLTGLPPSRAERRAFLTDDSPLAVQRVVDRLLDSPHFGERWGRHWLDLARYADSNGLDENFLFREAWRYRNWVIDAFNQDMAYDQFLLQQIAGDLMPYQSIEQRDKQRIASGFLVVGPKVLLGINPKLQKMDVADEQLSTIGTAVLGLTIGCARCHDHKFEPIPTQDYYAMAGIFTSTQVMEQRYMLGQQRKMEQLIGLGANGQSLDDAYEKYWRERPAIKKSKEKAEEVLKILKEGNKDAIAKMLKSDADSKSIAPEVKNLELSLEARVQAQENKVKALSDIFNHPPPIPPRAMVPVDLSEPVDESIRRAGQFDRLGEKVPRGFLRIVGGEHQTLPDNSSGRIELAHWLTDLEKGAGALTARVMANRIWYYLIGRGLVRTVDNFGVTGESPTHPELLDYLAIRLVESGWSIKSLIREIVLSRTFAMSSQYQDAAFQIDPENRYLWRANRQRIDPEVMRDAMLNAAGKLDLNPMNSSVWYLGDQATAVGANKNRRRTDFPNRSVYLPVIRNDLPEVFDVFDFTDPHMTTGSRPRTTVATQGLFMLNDSMVMDLAKETAQIALSGTSEDPLGNVFESICNRAPGSDEREQLLNYLTMTQERLTQDQVEDAELRSWSMLCHAIFSLSRFQFLE
jgi:hypothetical protein